MQKPTPHDKIIGIFNGVGDNPNASPGNIVNGPTDARFHVAIIDSVSFDEALEAAGSEIQNTGGCDLSNILIPYRAMYADIGSDSRGLPEMVAGALGLNATHGNAPSGASPRIEDLLPFRISQTGSMAEVSDKLDVSYERTAYGTVVSGKGFPGKTNRYINEGDIRGFGIRLPMIGVGWGYNTHDQPFADFTDATDYKGYLIEPSDYLAAPIDLRYDEVKGVWTTRQDTYQVRITGSGSQPGYFRADDLTTGLVWDGTPGNKPEIYDTLAFDQPSRSALGSGIINDYAGAINVTIHRRYSGNAPDATEEWYFNGDWKTHEIFAVKLTKTSGNAGNATQPCSFVYTVKDLNDKVLATGVNPTTSPHTYARMAAGTTTQASTGLACYVLVTGVITLSLRWINEVPLVITCP